MGQVVSVNLAEPRTLMRRGREVRTGLWKRPAERPVLVGELGLHGDLVGDLRIHGGRDKAVYAYAVEDTRWWEGELERELGPGFFGENLTVRDIDASGAPAGELWEVGKALLEVTEPRTPCWKLAERVGAPGFMKRFVAAQRPGTYLRVRREGEVAAGDPVRVLSRLPT
jgi:MOSC domain-containing protein YiiM